MLDSLSSGQSTGGGLRPQNGANSGINNLYVSLLSIPKQTQTRCEWNHKPPQSDLFATVAFQLTAPLTPITLHSVYLIALLIQIQRKM